MSFCADWWLLLNSKVQLMYTRLTYVLLIERAKDGIVYLGMCHEEKSLSYVLMPVT